MPQPADGPATVYDVIVYGGGFAGVAAAVGVAHLRPDASVLLVAPESPNAVGGLFTAGGQNYWDVRRWRGSLVQQGSCARWLAALGQFYKTDELEQLLQSELAAAGVAVLPGYDITEAACAGPPQRLTGLSLRQLRFAGGVADWDAREIAVQAAVFVDASDTGRLARLAGASLSVGRGDWPAPYLIPPERGGLGQPLQQAATLMFQVTGVQPGLYADMAFSEAQDASGRTVWGAWGGRRTFTSDPVVVAYNDAAGPQGVALKPLNAAQNGPDAEEWWVNTLLLFNVDARAQDRDRQTWRFPTAGDSRTTDAAWLSGRAALAAPEFLAALRRFPGFGGASLVPDADGLPVVGGLPYLRESVHAAGPDLPDYNGTENSAFAVSARALLRAGPRHASRYADSAYYSTRVGLGFYNADINAYRFADLKSDRGYTWPVTGSARPDFPGNPANPVYLPFACLLAPAVRNLLVAGFATGAAAMAFTALRVGPNLCVLGDAAAAAAAEALDSGADPADFDAGNVTVLQAALRDQLAARLEK